MCVSTKSNEPEVECVEVRPWNNQHIVEQEDAIRTLERQQDDAILALERQIAVLIRHLQEIEEEEERANVDQDARIRRLEERMRILNGLG